MQMDPGSLKFDLGCAAAEFESRLKQITILQKVTYSYANQTNFAPNFEQNCPIYLKKSLTFS